MKKSIRKVLGCLYIYLIYPFLVFMGYTFSRKEEKMAVLGPCEIAGVLSSLQKIYLDKSISYLRFPNPFYSSCRYNILLQNNRFDFTIKAPFLFGKLVKNAKCFIYVGGYSYTPCLERELLLLKKKSIPIIDIFLGSEIRSPVLYREDAISDNRNTYYDFIRQDENALEYEAKRNAELADKYATLIFSHKKDQISYIQKEQLFFPPIFDFSKIKNCMDKFENIEKIKILHAPSNPNEKGTPIVRAVIKALQSKGYDFEYKELMGVDNSVVLQEIRSSHIVLNQFYLLLPGIFGLEALANCTAVLMSASPLEFPYEFNDAWLETKDYQLFDNLKYLLDNPNEIKLYAQNGYNYIKDNFSEKSIREQINKYLNAYI